MVAAAQFNNLQKTYYPHPWSRSGFPAVRGVSLTVPKGAIFGLLGPNRAGKTTLIKMLLSLAEPTAGTVERLGKPISERRTLAQVGYMHENHAFPRYLTATEVLQFYGGLSGMSMDILPRQAEYWLTRVGLADRSHEPIARFSKGMVQRLGLAQAMINQPDLLILDEPTEGLDLTGRKLLREIVREQQAAGRTVMVVSHVLPEVEELCDRLAVIVAGKLCWSGTPEELRQGRSLESALQEIYDKGAAA